jgi:alginate biosynthesis protein Alg44
MVEGKNSLNKNIVHESETQRQHVRVEMPCKVTINDTIYKVHNISSGGFSVNTNGKQFKNNNNYKVDIIFPLRGADFKVETEAKVIHINKDIIGFTFTNLTKESSPVIRKIIRAYLAGTMTTEDDIINVYSGNHNVSQRKTTANDDNASGFKKFITVAAVCLLGLLGLFLIGSNVYENTLVVQAKAAYLDGEKLTVKTTANGTYHSLLSQSAGLVEKGQPIGVVKSNLPARGVQRASGSQTYDVVVKSPCDCMILKSSAPEGEFQTIGNTVMELFPRNGKMWVTASVDSENAHRLDFYDDVRIRIAGESGYIKGTIEEFILPRGEEVSTHKVRISIDETFPPQLIGKPALVEFIL